MATLKSVNLSIYIYSGISGSYTDADLKYTLQKSIISYQDNIVFEIAEIVRDYIDVNFNDDYISKTIWVTTVANLVDDTDTIFTYGSPVTNTNLAFDGYGFYEDEINPQLTAYDLISSNTIYLPKDTVGKLPVYAATTGSVVIDSATTDIVNGSGFCRGNDGNYSEANCNDSAEKILYITIPQNSNIIQIYATDKTTLKKTITVNNVCEPKFTPYKVTFVNRFGAFQDLYFFKKTTESFNVSDEKFKRNIINSSTVTYGVNQAQQTRYNINATSSISLNTGFIKEDMNETIEEMFLSENLWIRYNGKTLPIIPTTKNLQFKTVLNDKLIDYKVDFEFAFDKINNVR
tara:strand:+ start:923 stop:1960 length:1038 start_codon:yes stop_codon:yes gene_type:complete